MGKRDWPAPEEILRRAREECPSSLRAFIRSLGVSYTTGHDHLERVGILPEIQGLVKRRFSEPKYHDVLAPEGRAEYGKDAELKFLRKEHKRLQSAVADQEDLVERMVSLAAEPREPVRFAPRPFSGEKERDAILPLFDLQYGSDVRPKNVPGARNVHNAEIFQEKAERYVEAVCGSLEDYGASHSLKNLVFCLGGDLVEGWGIFSGQEWQIEFDPVEQTVRLVPILEEIIATIVGFAFEYTDVENAAILGVPGNHGAIGKGAMPSTASWDYLILKWLETRFENDERIGNFVIEPAGSLWFKSMGNTFLMVHGDEVRGWTGIPYYGLTRFDAQAMRLHNQMFDYLLIGHHHRPANIEVGFGEHLMSGNWIGATQYAKRIVAAGWPSQWLFYTSKEYGVAERAAIRLIDRAEAAKAPPIHALR